MLLEGKRIIVTGGVTGIGRATVLAMVSEGAAVVSVSRTPPDGDKAVALKDDAAKHGAGMKAHIQLDVTNQDEVNRVVDRAVDLMGGLDAVVNSAGYEQQKPSEDLTAQDFLDHFSINVMGTAFACSAACRHMKGRGGSIINYASYAGVGGMPMMAAYGAAKGGVVMYTRVIAKEWGVYNIRANAVCPAVMTDMAQGWYDQMSAEQFEEIQAWKKATIPLTGELGTPEDSAKLNVFLASDMSSYMTGQLIGVDGGMMMGR